MRSRMTGMRKRFLLAAVVLLFPTTVRAASVTVDCSGVTPGAFTTISAALGTLDNIGPHTITVTGTCVENVFLGQRDRLTIQAPGGQTATVSAANRNGPVFNVAGSHNIFLRRLVISGGSDGIGVGGGSLVTIEGTVIENNTGRGLALDLNSVALLGGNSSTQFVSIRNNGAAGLNANGSFALIIGGVTIENNTGAGIGITGGRLIVNGNVQENFIRGNSLGVNVSGAVATFLGQNSIQNNGDTGVQVVNGGSAAFNALHLSDGSFRVNVIEGHAQIGLHVAAAASGNLTGPNIIRSNGGAGFTSNDIHGGVNVGTVSRIQFSGGNQISNNLGPGIAARFNGAIVLGDSVVTNNTEQGLLLIRQSVGLVETGASISGNGAANAFCDSTSLLAGELTGVTNIDCSKVERTLGPPRPGAIKNLPNPLTP